MYGVGDKFEREITDEVVYSFEVLDIGENNLSVKIENLNPERDDYVFCIRHTEYIYNLEVDGISVEHSIYNGSVPVYLGEFFEAYYYPVPYIESSTVIKITYSPDQAKCDKINITSGNKPDAIYNDNFKIYGIAFRFYDVEGNKLHRWGD